MARSPIVIAGGGLVGLSVAYHLAKRGAKEVFLFERHCIGAHNSTRISTGMINNPCFYTDRSLQSIVRKSHELYAELDTGGTLGFTRCGRVYLASSDDTAVQARRLFSRLSADSANSAAAAELLDCPSEMLSRWPMVATEDIKVALFSPLDATIDVQSLCRQLGDRCRAMGVHIHESVGVKRVLLNERRTVYAVDTDEGFIETGAFVNAAGIWAGLVEVPQLPDRQVRLAAHPCAYTFLTTNPLPRIGRWSSTTRCGTPSSPIFVAMDENVYVCPTEFRTISGGFVESDLNALALPTQTKGVPEWHIPAPSWDSFATVLHHLVNRFPPMAKLSRGSLLVGAEMYTPDSRPLIGESDQASGYFIVNGMNGQGLSFAGGLGDLVAQWVLEGRAPCCTTRAVVDKLDVSRFLPLHANPQYLFQRMPEVACNIFKNLTSTHQCHALTGRGNSIL